MKKLITQAPIQTREDSTDRLERLFPILVAEILSKLEEYKLNKELPRIDFWNTYGLKMETQMLNNEVQNPRDNYVKELIQKRYTILEQQFDIPSINRVSLRDDDYQVKEIVLDVLRDLYNKNILTMCDIKVVYCTNCNLVIAPVHIKPTICKRCKLSQLGHKIEKLLTINVTNDIKEKLQNTSSLYNLSKIMNNYINNLPPQIIISKQREFGISLENYDIDPKFKLDPKITLALQGAILKELFDIDDCTILQGIDSMKNTVPLALILHNNFNSKFKPLAYLPNIDLYQLNKENPGFLNTFMALYSIDNNSIYKSEQFYSLVRQFQKTRIKIQNCFRLIDILNQNYNIDTDYNQDKLQNIIKDQQNIQKILQDIRKMIYEDISKEYLPSLQSKFKRPSPYMVEDLKDIYNLFYGQIIKTEI